MEHFKKQWEIIINKLITKKICFFIFILNMEYHHLLLIKEWIRRKKIHLKNCIKLMKLFEFVLATWINNQQ